MGGAERVLAEGQRAFDEGDYRWAARVLNHLVFADPTTPPRANCLRARTGRWRTRPRARSGATSTSSARANSSKGRRRARQPTQSADLIAATPTSYILDLLAVRLNPERLGNRRYAFNLVFPERNERFAVTIANGVLVHERDQTVDGRPPSPRRVRYSCKPWPRKAWPALFVRTNPHRGQQKVA